MTDTDDRDSGAAASGRDDRLPAETRIGRAALRVADLDETTAFYRDVVGLAVLDRDAERATLGAGGTPLLVLERDADRPARSRTDAGLFHTAFRVRSRAALGEALGRVGERWRLDGASDHLVSEALYLDDPEGNGVEIYRDRPREEWPRAEDGTVRMATDPLDVEGVAAAATDGSGDGGAGSEALVDRAPADTDVGHVHLEVTSLSAFEAVYVDGLGFETGMSGPDVRFVAAGGYHHHLGANTWRGRTTPAAGRGIAWFEVVVPDAAALETIRARLGAVATEGDAEFAVAERDDGIAVTDADGIEIRVRTE
ncbi:glyoxalase/bleomycin resistance protein/dioxygenase [Halorubrum californiense DSM 19288]|uniref:Glyoxalase/bleomycin resistance protein/dioxygenase n=1 Tax=Halorubrum californiense DSM 19288 TaxID=1227465 RepID=M0EAJ4_9EURY|nr:MULTISPECIES: VOC family protein [Halorubrum]ELZ43907.1 glyoxalase/bleomycin resistance protein/dioxygenase [Halorubrum californiense DSM 19288]TKX71264.1 VOC family protein [Halorubrum sp. GN11GM_10-3_MGM]